MPTIRNQRLRTHSITLLAAFEKYLKEVSSKKKGKFSEISLVRVWTNTLLSSRTLASIKSTDLVRLRDEWLSSFASATVVRRLAIISHLYTVAIKDWGMTYLEDPTKMLRRPIVINERSRRIVNNINLYSSEQYPKCEIEWVSKNTKSLTLPTIISIAVETAMRRAEIVRIRREHINFRDSVLIVPESKNGKSREIPLSPWCKYIIIDYLTKNNNRGLIFKTTEGAVTRSFIRALRKSRCQYETICLKEDIEASESILKDLRFHDLRHEATSRLAEVYEMHELAKITGHADTRMLLRYYHPNTKIMAMKLANSKMGQEQFNKINENLLGKL